jgi:hypothetical protein
MSGQNYQEILAGQTYCFWRALLVGPVAFAITGAALGLCWAMLYRYEPSEHARVYIENSIPPAFCGALVGLLVGWGVAGLCIWRPGLRSALTVLAAMLLCGSAAAPLGWIAGDSRAIRDVPEYGPASEPLEALPRAGMTLAAACGSVIGFGIGLVEWLVDRRIAAGSRGEHGCRSEPGRT